jgi:cell division protein FtsZ
MGTAVAEGDNKAVEASNLALTNPLIENIDMNTAKGVIVNISGGSDMTLLEVDHAANIIRQSVNPDANIIFGSLIDETLQGKLKISIFATGIEATGKKILYYPESENSSGFSSLQSKVNSGIDDNRDIVDQNTNIDEGSLEPNNSEQEFKLSNEEEAPKIQEEGANVYEKNSETSINFKNLEEKKKTGFFSMLSNLMSSDNKNNESSGPNKPEKKMKVKKEKTDPNLFLFNDVVVESAASINENNTTEISELSEISSENELVEDIDTPSYLRKGSGQ